ncbi:hypothetical protein HDU76_005037, partial [Blyttiomyces sp. JEL0837]
MSTSRATYKQHFPELDYDNYADWIAYVLDYVRGQKLNHVIDPSTRDNTRARPAVPGSVPSNNIKFNNQFYEYYAEDDTPRHFPGTLSDNSKVSFLLRTHVIPQLRSTVSTDTTVSAYDNLKNLEAAVSGMTEDKINRTVNEFYGIKQESDPLKVYLTKFQFNQNELQILRRAFPDNAQLKAVTDFPVAMQRVIDGLNKDFKDVKHILKNTKNTKLYNYDNNLNNVYTTIKNVVTSWGQQLEVEANKSATTATLPTTTTTQTLLTHQQQQQQHQSQPSRQPPVRIITRYVHSAPRNTTTPYSRPPISTRQPSANYPPRTCYECGSPNHLVQNCPILQRGFQQRDQQRIQQRDQQRNDFQRDYHSNFDQPRDFQRGSAAPRGTLRIRGGRGGRGGNFNAPRVQFGGQRAHLTDGYQYEEDLMDEDQDKFNADESSEEIIDAEDLYDMEENF